MDYFDIGWAIFDGAQEVQEAPKELVAPECKHYKTVWFSLNPNLYLNRETEKQNTSPAEHRAPGINKPAKMMHRSYIKKHRNAASAAKYPPHDWARSMKIHASFAGDGA